MRVTIAPLVCPPFRPTPLPIAHQDTDGGLWDISFDADVRSLDIQDCSAAGLEYTSSGIPTVEDCQSIRLALTDSSKHRNHAWLNWWRACNLAESRGCSILIARYAPRERPGYPSHERHIKACTTRLLNAMPNPEEPQP